MQADSRGRLSLQHINLVYVVNINLSRQTKKTMVFSHRLLYCAVVCSHLLYYVNGEASMPPPARRRRENHNILIISYFFRFVKRVFVQMYKNLRFTQKIIVKFLQIAYWKSIAFVIYYRWRKEGTLQWQVKLQTSKRGKRNLLNGPNRKTRRCNAFMI